MFTFAHTRTSNWNDRVMTDLRNSLDLFFFYCYTATVYYLAFNNILRCHSARDDKIFLARSTALFAVDATTLGAQSLVRKAPQILKSLSYAARVNNIQRVASKLFSLEALTLPAR